MLFENILFKVHVPNEAGIGNTLKGFISGLTINKNTKIECNNYSMLGNFVTVLDEKYILTQDDYNKYIIEPFSTCRWLILKEEELIQKDLPYEYSNYNEVDLNNNKYKHIFTPKVTIDHYYDKSLINEKVYNRFINVIKGLTFKKIIYDEVEMFLQKYNIRFSNSLGISVRTWKSPHEYNINRIYNSDIYKNEIHKNINNNINFIFISVDNNNVEQEYIDFCKVNYPNIPVVLYNKPHYINYLQYCIIKMLLLSKCGIFICNRISTFSELVFWFSECKQVVKPLF
jgi:hypothetical protein